MTYEEILLMTKGKSPSNPSKTATAKVKNPLPIPEVCRYCDAEVKVATHIEIYGIVYGRWPFTYCCSNCRAYVGMHPFTNIPLGTLADAETRQARAKSKNLFNPIWENGYMTRSEAYQWIANELGIPIEECHFGWFDTKTCNKVMEVIVNWR